MNRSGQAVTIYIDNDTYKLLERLCLLGDASLSEVGRRLIQEGTKLLKPEVLRNV